jgi:hypothetical protein
MLPRWDDKVVLSTTSMRPLSRATVSIARAEIARTEIARMGMVGGTRITYLIGLRERAKARATMPGAIGTMSRMTLPSRDRREARGPSRVACTTHSIPPAKARGAKVAAYIVRTTVTMAGTLIVRLTQRDETYSPTTQSDVG